MDNVTMYWDVDGVFNSMSGRPPKSMTKWTGDWDQQRVSTLEGDSWMILWSKELVEAVNKLSELSNVTMKWLTTWEGSAPAFIAPALGLTGAEDWEVIYADGDTNVHSTHDWWKRDVIQRDVAKNPDSRFIWIDDDIKYDTTSIKWMRDVIGDNGLMISPNVYLGVTKEDIDDIMEFISKN